ncbi:MAG: glycosyltransferase family 4 protein [bacterium]|nr:glycosyltransferase family 4 protein [bacterium]
MKILHITTAFKRNEEDIITPWLVNLLQEQTKNSDVIVLTSGYGSIPKRQTFDKIHVRRFSYASKRMMKLTHDLAIQDYISQHPLSVFLLPSFFITGAIECFRIAKEKKIDSIVVHWPFPLFFIAFPAKFLLNAKIISVFYGAELKLFKNKFRMAKFIFKFICKNSDSLIAISNSTGEEVKELSGAENVDVIPYGVQMKEERDFRKDKLILTVGRQVERKGTEYLIKAMKLVREDYRLAVIGEGPELPSLKRIVNEENLVGRVSFEGWVRDDELDSMYERAKIFVLPAIYDSRGETEGLGMVLVEAMAHGAVCVATGIGGITDIIKDNETGLFSEEKNPEDIAEKIERIIDDNELYARIQNKAFDFVARIFSIASINERYIELLKGGRNEKK